VVGRSLGKRTRQRFSNRDDKSSPSRVSCDEDAAGDDDRFLCFCSANEEACDVVLTRRRWHSTALGDMLTPFSLSGRVPSFAVAAVGGLDESDDLEENDEEEEEEEEDEDDEDDEEEQEEEEEEEVDNVLFLLPAAGSVVPLSARELAGS
jgi:hypothetical protein